MGGEVADGVFAALRDLAREAPIEVEVRGDCMAPRLADGERVRVAAVRFYWPGDVVVFRAPDGRLLAHRVLGYRFHRLHGRGVLALVTRGDSCVVHDAPVPFGRVLGRVAGAAPSLAVRAVALRRFLGLVLHRRRARP